ncbi:hypothetical protein I7I50_01375 [Histoplasma capsulatum G186AR]|uniref:Uncharacterized protein n=1 Tax=Ajellomyces capsulatus TaxID=5037 RepID=A0A8H7YD48_AJECA|nr:hypothetical protein I7I52_12491 [Histoplasma capsulatum]QSS73269.1 hypothetical protein I7I50_01375 [Histoplasma capsulatum G186AR]
MPVSDPSRSRFSGLLSPPLPDLLTNVDKLAVNGLKSSTHVSSGILPVRARPMAINGAACVHIKMAWLCFSSAGISRS